MLIKSFTIKQPSNPLIMRLLAFLTFIMFMFSCEQNLDNFEDANSSQEVSETYSKNYTNPALPYSIGHVIQPSTQVWLSSKVFRAKYKEALSSTESNVVILIDATNEIVTATNIPGETPEAKTIRVIIRDHPTLPDGMYLQNLCNGELINMVGNVVATLPGFGCVSGGGGTGGW